MTELGQEMRAPGRKTVASSAAAPNWLRKCAPWSASADPIRRVALAAVAVVLAAGCAGRSHPLALSAAPASYRIVYRVTSGKDVSTRIVEARRPFDVRTEDHEGPPPGGQLRSLSVGTFTRLLTRAGDADPVVIQVPPSPAPGDPRPDAGLQAALEAKRVRAGGRRHVLGRTCQVYRADDGVESCIDAAGLLLEERSTGRVTVAVGVDVHPLLSDERFAVEGTPLTIQQGGGSVRPVDPSSLPPGSWWVLPEPPAGFTAKGRYAVVPPNQAEGFSDPTKRDSLIAGFADVYVRGPDVLVVDQGSTLGGGPPFGAEDRTLPIDLGAPGQGEVVPTLGTVQARIAVGGGHFLRLVGTLPPRQLESIAAHLVQQPGSALRYLD
jgi:hypothetical protein